MGLTLTFVPGCAPWRFTGHCSAVAYTLACAKGNGDGLDTSAAHRHPLHHLGVYMHHMPTLPIQPPPTSCLIWHVCDSFEAQQSLLVVVLYGLLPYSWRTRSSDHKRELPP